MLLLTGATGLVGSPLLRRLTARREPVRCLVRDPKGLGTERVRVQIALGDLAEPSSFRHALRGVKTVVHLAASERDQPGASIEEVVGLGTWRLLKAAERAGAEHFVFVSCLGATPHHRSRVMRAKALAEQALADSALRTTVLRCSMVYAPGDRRLTLLHLLSLLPVVPVTSTMKHARSQPVWAEDVADCIAAVLEDPPTEEHRVLEIAGPHTLSHREVVGLVLELSGRPRPLVALPSSLILQALHAYEALTGPIALTTRGEADVLGSTMLAHRGTADAQSLGVNPRPVREVLAA